MGHIKAGHSATLAIHSSPSSPAQLPPLGDSDAQPASPAEPDAAVAKGAPASSSAASAAVAPVAPAQASEAGGGGSGKRHPSSAADGDARHLRSQADVWYRIRQLAGQTAEVQFAELEAPLPFTEVAAAAASRADAGRAAVSTASIPTADASDASADASQADDSRADVSDASADAELPEESAWLLERARERERNAVPWLQSTSEEFSLAQQFPCAAKQARLMSQPPTPRPLGGPFGGALSPVAVPAAENCIGGAGRSERQLGAGRSGSAPSLLGSSPVNARKVPFTLRHPVPVQILRASVLAAAW